MSTIILTTNLSETEFKEFLKAALKEILSEGLDQLKPQEPKPLDINEAAALLKLKITTLYEKTCRKLIPHFKKGNKVYFDKAELLQWIKGGKVKTQEEAESDALTFLLRSKTKKR